MRNKGILQAVTVAVFDDMTTYSDWELCGLFLVCPRRFGESLFLKWLVLIAMALVTTVSCGDVAHSWYVFPHAEWMSEMAAMERLDSGLLQVGIPCSAFVIFLVVLVFSMRQRRPSYLLWLAWFSPLPLFVPMTYDWFEALVFPLLGVLAVSWLVPVVFYLCTRRFVQALGCLIVAPLAFVLFWYLVGGICISYLGSFREILNRPNLALCAPVEIRKGESYEEYLKRANRIIHHHCGICDKPMKDYWRDYWRCPDCNKGEMTCSKCGAQKEQQPLGLYRLDGFKWMCPNCDKERREKIKRQVEKMKHGS